MNKPEKKFSCSPISASIWANTKVVTGETVKFYSVTINKAYKEGEEWKHMAKSIEKGARVSTS